MSSRCAIHQVRANRSRTGSSSQAHNLLYGWSPEPETEREPDPFAGPPLSDFSRGLPKRNRAPSGRRPSISQPTAKDRGGPSRRRSSLAEKLRAATGRRPSKTTPSAKNDQTPRKRGSSLEAAASRKPTTISSRGANDALSRKRGPSLVAKAKELLNYPTTNAQTEPSFRRLPDQLSRNEESASENEKIRLSIEADTPCFCLIQRWKDPKDWLVPSKYWKRTHIAMNFRLWRIIARNPSNHWRLQASAERNLEAATLLYSQEGGNSEEWWPEDLEEEILNSWALGFGGHDPPRCKWTLDE
ncbi:hypothetical protein IMSHALPRED_010261 [Imshaugia aleurites]|uniref:Uncharacterized protein n=1 Tax=Imshaugia aleurites TaxID=172621 RepID=A0A8H3G2M2_9LECA|nr:hypothetical protein IMSHALPRED_010261 [Imshaugia aleurites]